MRLSGTRVFLFSIVIFSALGAASAMSNAAGAFPGTSWKRMELIRRRVSALSPRDLSQDWPEVRRTLLRAAGLRDVSDTRRVGTGFTGHCFADSNHCDATAMLLERFDDKNTGNLGVHAAISRGNHLGDGIRAASFPIRSDAIDGDEDAARSASADGDGDGDDDGGTWCTCMNGCAQERDGINASVAHRQFRSMVAFKLVWAPPNYTSFVLVDDDGVLLNYGAPVGQLPPPSERRANYSMTRGSKYARAAEELGSTQSEEL